jgi:hypothetical protein
LSIEEVLMPSVRAMWLTVCSSVLLLACGGGSSGGGGGGGDTRTTTEQLVALKAHAIYFGHQSVGQNLMDGVDDLLAAVPAADRMARGGISEAGTGVWADAGVDSNGHPLQKLDDFQSQMASLCGKVDIAFMKFCWADAGYIGANGAQALFDAYKAKMDAIHAACPSATLVHVTMPITTGDNTSIEAYNALLRNHYGTMLFDLATEESTKPDGSRAMSGGVPVLFADYASDSGHLNTTGRDRIAAELIAFLANL